MPPAADRKEVKRNLFALKESPVDAFPRIACDPAVMLGKPVIRGTRITVELILERLAGGASIDDILVSYPHLTREGVQEAVRYAAEAMRLERVLAAS